MYITCLVDDPYPYQDCFYLPFTLYYLAVVGTLMETPVSSSAGHVILGATPPGPMTEGSPDLTIRPLDSTMASPTVQVEVHVHLYSV